MMLKISVTFLSGMFHGRGDGGEPEWPPSPLRLFQALIAVSGNEPLAALDWFAELPPPIIIAPVTATGTPYTSSVPNNAMDLVAKAWSKGGGESKDAQPSTHRTMKTIQPTHLLAEPEQQQVVYLWEVADTGETKTHSEAISELASRLVAMGWGLDLVAGHAERIEKTIADNLSGERWLPSAGGSVSLRVPLAETQEVLRDRHRHWLNRVSSGTLIPVSAIPPGTYRSISYSRATDPPVVSVAAFSLLQPDASGYRTYNPRRGTELAGMLRHLTAEAARRAGQSEEFINQFALGHGESRNHDHQPVGLNRLAYVPLPSLEPRVQGGRADTVSLIRRCLLSVPEGGADRAMDWLRKTLPGNLLHRPQVSEPDALLSLLPTSDRIVQRYLRPRVVWASVSPVILPGLDERKDKKTEGLIRKAIVQAGYSKTLAEHALIDWSPTGFWPGTLRADQYFVPRHLQRFPRYHVKISWADSQGNALTDPPVSGPIIIGGGRFFGLGLMAGME